MLDHRISGLPVVDNDGALVGIVTEGDLLRERKDERERTRWLEIFVGSEKFGREARLSNLRTVGEVMTVPVVTVSEDTPVRDIVNLMERHGIKRMPVVRDKKVIGIVSRADLLRGLALEAKLMPAATGEDYALRERVLDALAKEPREGWRSVNVAVQNGSVELRGATSEAGVKKGLVAAAGAVPGVREVIDRLVVVGPESGRT
jgi:predicted transcriptional regulator